MTRSRSLLIVINIAVTGAYFGLLQWATFFVLQSSFAATAMVYLLATVVWLIGSVLGLTLSGPRNEVWWWGFATLGYYALLGVGRIRPFDLSVLPLLMLFVAGMGAYAGRFFRYRRGLLPRTKHLFLVENTGFIVGMLATVSALFWAGESFLLFAPAVVATVCVGTALPLKSESPLRNDVDGGGAKGAAI